MESRIVELERLAQVSNRKLHLMATALTEVVLYLSERHKQTAESEPLPSIRPPQTTGITPLQADTPLVITQKDVSLLVPAVRELQQLYTDLCEHLRKENFDGRVARLEAHAAECIEIPDEFDHEEVLERLSQLEVESDNLRVGALFTAGGLTETEAKKRLHIIEETVNAGHASGNAMMAEMGRQLCGFIDALRVLEDKVTALDNVVVYHTVDPVVVNWDRFHIMAGVDRQAEQIAGFLATQAWIEHYIQQQELLNSHFANEQKKLERGLSEARQWVGEVVRDVIQQVADLINN